MDYKAGFWAREETMILPVLWQSFPFMDCVFPSSLLEISQHDYMKQRMISKPSTFAYSAQFQNNSWKGNIPSLGPAESLIFESRISRWYI